MTMMMSGWMMMARMILTIPVMIMSQSLHSPLCHDFVTPNAFHCWKSRYQTFADCSLTITRFLLQKCCKDHSLECRLFAEIDSFYFDLTQDWLSEIYLYFEINA